MSFPATDLQKTETSGGVRCTFEQFMAQADEDVWAEWVEGEVFVMSPASDQHQDLVGFLAALLRLFVEANEVGWVRTAPFAMHLADRAREPDLLFVRKERMDRVQSTYLEGPADLVVEIISAESIARDRGDKFVEYEAGGVAEYWLIDPLRERGEFYRLDVEGRYAQMPLEAGVLTSEAVAGFRLRVDWLWRKPLPKILVAAAELGLLAGLDLAGRRATMTPPKSDASPPESGVLPPESGALSPKSDASSPESGALSPEGVVLSDSGAIAPELGGETPAEGGGASDLGAGTQELGVGTLERSTP